MHLDIFNKYVVVKKWIWLQDWRVDFFVIVSKFSYRKDQIPTPAWLSVHIVKGTDIWKKTKIKNLLFIFMLTLLKSTIFTDQVKRQKWYRWQIIKYKCNTIICTTWKKSTVSVLNLRYVSQCQIYPDDDFLFLTLHL